MAPRVAFHRRDERKMRRLAGIESAARNVDTIPRSGSRRGRVAEGVGGGSGHAPRVEETRALIHRLSELVDEEEDVIDMAPGISAGHDGVLVATDRRLLFISVRRTLSFP